MNGENLLTMGKAAAYVQKRIGKRPDPSTVWRWCRKGVFGVRLEHIRVGRQLATSAEALERFWKTLAETTNPHDPTPSPEVPRPARPRTARQVEKDATHARKVLEEAGIL